MPGYSWGLSAHRCITGQQLRKKCPDSPCANCYALKGRYAFPNVQAASERRYAAWEQDPDWVFKMAGLIARRVKTEDPYFRWFDTGDLQSPHMLRDIFAICELRTDILFWLPTQERLMVSRVLEHQDTPKNLVVRVSLPQINGPRPKNAAHTSSVLPRIYKRLWPDRVARSTQARHYCPAPLQENSCGDCRACWDRDVSNVLYLEH